MQKLPDVFGHQHVVGVLKDQARHRHVGQVSPVVGKKSCLGKHAGCRRICGAEAVGQLVRDRICDRRTRYHGPQVLAPAHVILVHEVEQVFQVFALKTTGIVRRQIQEAGSWSHPHLLFEQPGALDGCKQANAATDRVANKGDVLSQPQCVTHIQYVLGISRQIPVARGVECRQV